MQRDGITVKDLQLLVPISEGPHCYPSGPGGSQFLFMDVMVSLVTWL